MKLLNYEKYEKRRLKKKVKITNAVLISLLLTGTISYGAEGEKGSLFGQLNKESQNHLKLTKITEVKKKRIVKDPELLENSEEDVLVFFNINQENDKRHDSKDGVSNPAAKPDRPNINDVEGLMPEVDSKEVIIWENGNKIYGDTYTLNKNLEMVEDIDGLKTTGGTIINQSIINSNAWFGDNYAMRVEDHADGRQGIGINKGNITGGSNGMIATNGGEIINETTGTINVLGKAMNSDGIGTLALNKGSIIGSGGGMRASNSGIIINEGTTNGMSAYTDSIATNKGTTGGITGVDSSLLNLGTINNGGMGAQGGSAINEGIMNNSVGISVTNKGFGLNKGELISADNNSSHPQVFGMTAKNGSTIINEGTLISSNSDGGMESDSEGSVASNKGLIQNDSGSGMIALNNAFATNEEIGVITGNDNNYGMWASGTEALATNKGIISNNGTSNMIASRGATIINDESGTLSNSKESGMEASGKYNSRAINKGTIKDSQTNGMRGHTETYIGNTSTGMIINSKKTGIYAAGVKSTGFNFGTILDSGVNGMYTDSKGTIINQNGGKIIGSKETGMHVSGLGASGTNNGEIVSEKQGMYTNKGTITNNELITINGNDGIGMGADGGTVVSKGTINITGDNGIGILVRDSATGVNEGEIIATKDGMYSYLGNIDNKGSIIINESSGVGMETKEGIATNSGIIKSINGVDLYAGMLAKEGGSIINNAEGRIEIKGRNGGMYVIGKGSTGINKGVISVEGSSGLTIVNGATGLNEGTILVTEGNGLHISSQGAQGINRGVIRINGNFGMRIDGENSIGINETGGIISAKEYAFSVGSNGKGINNGIIELINEESYKRVVRVEENGIMINGEEGIVNVKGDNSDGVYISGGGQGINNGTLNTNGEYNSGMKIQNEGEAINKGTINLNGNNNIGLYGTTKGTVVMNQGTININGDDGIGILIEEGATGINDDTGIINLNGNNGIGIKVDGAESTYVNNGEINIAEGTTGNQDIKLINGAAFSNSGSVIAEGEFNTNKMGNGQFIMSEGGTLEAEVIKGDIYASGALALGGYEDEYSTYKMLKTNNLEGEIISNSAMFDAEVTENKDENGFYDVILERKDFHDIMNNQNLADILEDNYVEGGSDLKEDYYDSLKLTSTEKELEDNVKSSYGMDTYPTFSKQTFDIVNNTRKVIAQNILKDQSKLELGEFRAIAGGDFLNKDNDGYSGVSGYETDMYSVYFGGEKQIRKDIKVGGILTVGNANTGYYNGSKREDDYFQGTTYMKYQNDNHVAFTTSLFIGTAEADVERNLQFGLIADTMGSMVRSNYIGTSNALSKRYYITDKKSYIEPRLELNFTYINQEDINENGDYALKIEGESSYSIEPGIGIAVGHNFILENGSKINLEGSLTGYAELGTPYKESKSELNVLSNKKITIDKYDGNDYYGKVNVGLSYTTKKDLTFKVESTFQLGENQDNVEYGAGMTYKF